MLEAIRWDGANVAEIERFVGRSTVVVDDVLEVRDLPRGVTLVVPLGGWLVRAEGRVHVLGADALPAQPPRPELDAERVDKVGDVLAFESGFD